MSVSKRRAVTKRWWFQDDRFKLRRGMRVFGRDGQPFREIVRLTPTGVVVRDLAGGEPFEIPRGFFEDAEDERVTKARIAADAAAQGFEWDADIEGWVRIVDGVVNAVMVAAKVPQGGGTWGWYCFDPDTDEQIGDLPDRTFELDDAVRETAPYLACPFYPNRCHAQQHLAEWGGGGWVLICPNNRRGSWDNERLAREALHPDSKPGVDLHDGHQQARPGTTSVRWSGGSGRGSL